MISLNKEKDIMSQLVLVTGATGFIANHVIEQLLKSEVKVRGTVRDLKNQKKVDSLKNLCPEAENNLELVEADLNNADCWDSALTDDVTDVYHIASPFPSQQPDDPEQVIRPAVDGTLNVLKACRKKGTIRRVVLTSSGLTVGDKSNGKPIVNEEDWAPLSENNYYQRSKVLAEKAAWEFVEELPEEEKFELVTILPGFVLGPLLTQSSGTSTGFVKRLLEREITAVGRIHFAVTDVRDLAKCHIQAMNCPEAANKRIICCHQKGLWMLEVSQMLHKEFGPLGYNPPVSQMPDFVIKFLAVFKKELRVFKNNLGQKQEMDNSRMTELLKVDPRDKEDTIRDMGHSLIALGIVKKTEQYTNSQTKDGPPPTQEAEN